jgi:hypothetical protein
LAYFERVQAIITEGKEIKVKKTPVFKPVRKALRALPAQAGFMGDDTTALQINDEG